MMQHSVHASNNMRIARKAFCRSTEGFLIPFILLVDLFSFASPEVNPGMKFDEKSTMFFTTFIQPNRLFFTHCKVDNMHMKIRIFLFALCAVFLAGNLYAQSSEDVVYLKNGSILRGKVIENVTGVRTSIEIIGHNLIVIPDSAVKMILMDQKSSTGVRENAAGPLEVSANVSFYGGEQRSGGFTFIPSYRFPFRLAVGAGIGVEWFDHQQIPFFADAKYSFLKGSWSPYVYAQGGYSIPMTKSNDGDYADYYGGAMAGIGGGLRFDFSKHNALIFSLGYRYQKTKTVMGYYPWMSSMQSETTRYDEYNRLAFSFGFLFN